MEHEWRIEGKLDQNNTLTGSPTNAMGLPVRYLETRMLAFSLYSRSMLQFRAMDCREVTDINLGIGRS